MTSALRFRAIAKGDLPLLAQWHPQAHVAEWWQPVPSLEDLREEYGERLAPQTVRPLDAPAGVQQYLVLEGDAPVAYMQAYRVMAHQAEGWWPDETDPCALGVDQFIGPAERLNQGLGTRMLRAFLAFLFEDPRATSVQTDPDPNNPRAIRAYEKAGFQALGVVTTLDGPALLMKAERQAWQALAATWATEGLATVAPIRPTEAP